MQFTISYLYVQRRIQGGGGGHSGYVPPPPPPSIYKFITFWAAFYNNSCTIALPIDTRTYERYYCTISRAPRYAIIPHPSPTPLFVSGQKPIATPPPPPPPPLKPGSAADVPLLEPKGNKIQLFNGYALLCRNQRQRLRRIYV